MRDGDLLRIDPLQRSTAIVGHLDCSPVTYDLPESAFQLGDVDSFDVRHQNGLEGVISTNFIADRGKNMRPFSTR